MKCYRWPAVFLVLALAVAACNRSDDVTASRSGSTASTSSESGSDNTKRSAFADLTGVCQAGDPSGSPAQGVTPTEIEISTFSDPGFAGRPGLNQELFDTAEVFSRWCNERGGINGREIVVHDRDAALTNVKAQMTIACGEDFMPVGGASVFDQDGVATRLECLMPDIPAYLVSAQARGADLVVQPVPNPIDVTANGVFKYLGTKFPDGAKTYGILTPDLPSPRDTGAQHQEVVDALGWTQVYNDVYPALGPTSWTPYAQSLKSDGVKGLIWVGEPEFLAKLVQAMNDIGYQPDFISANPNHYDRKLIANAGDALKGNVYISSAFFPFEEAKAGTATKQYLDAFAEYLPEGKSHTYLGLEAFSAWLLFAQAATACGNDLSRKCVYDNARSVADWTGGGLHVAQNPGANRVSTCFTILKAMPQGFVRVKDLEADEAIFHCDPNDVHKLKRKVGEGVTLQDVGKSMADFK